MNGKAWQRGCVLGGHAVKKAGFVCGFSVLVVLLLMTGCAHKQPQDMQNLVHKEISDPARAEKILALMDQMEDGINFQKMIVQDTQKQFMRLNGDYNTTPEQIQELLDGTKESREKNRQKIMDAFFQIQALTTPQEWEALSKVEIQNYPDFLKKIEASGKDQN
ncbi:MAG TPA: hypothetical protein VN416_03710 [Desulfomonilia bacterium]|nr:hypothetical protein [Desulfomonilia bacterium]